MVGKGEDVRSTLLFLGHLQSGWQPNLTDTWGLGLGMGFGPKPSDRCCGIKIDRCQPGWLAWLVEDTSGWLPCSLAASCVCPS
jgi:hypothetical protein